MHLSIPGRGELELRHLALDLNGTLGLDGRLLEGVAERLTALRGRLQPLLLTADTHGGAAQVRAELGLEVVVLDPGRDEAAQKLEFVRRLGVTHVVAVGNGANDVSMLKECAVGVCVIGPEGAATEALLSADVVVADIRAALDLLLHPKRLVATLRR
jgi:P-type E1-E2 ATPase